MKLNLKGKPFFALLLPMEKDVKKINMPLKYIPFKILILAKLNVILFKTI